MNQHGYSLIELLIALALLGVAIKAGAHSIQWYAHTESLIMKKLSQAQIEIEAWEKHIATGKIFVQ
jgi:prepilin-type N-terminal cleavage/methylation domain-containing protein